MQRHLSESKAITNVKIPLIKGVCFLSLSPLPLTTTQQEKRQKRSEKELFSNRTYYKSVCTIYCRDARTGQDFGKQKEFHWVWQHCIFFSHPSKVSFPFFLHRFFSISKSLTHFLPASLQFYRSEGSSLHGDIMTLTSQIQQDCLISSVSLSGLNYSRQALSRQHQANIHPTLSYSNCGSREHIPTEIQHAAVSLPSSSCTNLCLYSMYQPSLSLTCCLHCWTQFLRGVILLSLKIPDPSANLRILRLSWG